MLGSHFPILIVLLSTYDMGRQPFGLASPAAWLRNAGFEVACADLSLSKLPLDSVKDASLVGIYLPMHTATRLAVPVIARVRSLNPGARICCYGLYAQINAEWLRTLGVDQILGGEFEGDLVRLARSTPALGSLERLAFQVPDRSGLPSPEHYVKLQLAGGGTRTVGYTESSRGCKHLCRHCPVVPAYQGKFLVVDRDVVLADIRQQVRAGVEHITFGDPDFWNGPTHAMRILEAMHSEFPGLTFDATIKIEHLRRHHELIRPLRAYGCLFVTSAVESIDDEVLRKLDKGHTRADFFAVVENFRKAGLALAPTFIAFLPWTTRESYGELLRAIRALDLVENVSPIQLALRLLLPNNSRLLELEEIRNLVTGYDAAALTHTWRYPDEERNLLAAKMMRIINGGAKLPRSRVFAQLWKATFEEDLDLVPRAAIPHLNEPWYC
jgi:radical SAM superfamily enzyme YgiQ (UPF0313 family)